MRFLIKEILKIIYNYKMIIKINLYNNKVEVIRELEEGWLSEVRSEIGNVYDYEEYLIIDMREEG